MEFRTPGTRTLMRTPVQCRSSISSSVQLYQGLPWRQYMVCSNEAHRHREQETRPNQARGCWRRNIKEPASGTDHQAKNESNHSGCQICERDWLTAFVECRFAPAFADGDRQ